jgi:hypothetical protein
MKRVLKVIFISFLLFSVTGCVENSDVSTIGGENKKKEITTLRINEDAFIKNDEGEIRIKFLSVKETSERNEFFEGQVDRVVVIEYEYENKSREDDIFISDMSFKLYDNDNNALETYPAGVTKYPTNISTGRKMIAQESYVLNDDNNYIELEFYDNIFVSKADAKFILEW